MTKLLVALVAGLAAGLSAAPEPPATPAAPAAVVVDGSGPGAAGRIARARGCAAERGAVLRIPRTLREQVAVTTALAATGHRRVYAAGLELPYATAPLRGRLRVLDLGRC